MDSQLLSDIVCFEAGSGEPPWQGEVGADDLEKLKRLAENKTIVLATDTEGTKITGKDCVGLLLLPSGRRLIIRSKVSGLILLEYLAYLGEFPPLQAWMPESGVSLGSKFPECLAQLFLRELDHLTRLHVRKDYTLVSTAESTVRGRVLTTQLFRQFHRLPRIPQQHRSRTFNTRYNIVLALALDCVPRLLAEPTPADLKLLARMRDLWEHIDRQIADPVSAVTEAQWACPSGYRTTLQLARLILIGAFPDQESPLGGQTFTLPLDLIWERSLRSMFDEISRESGWLSVANSERTRNWDDSLGESDSNRRMTTDVMVEKGIERWVIDAKYKRAFGNESREDRFQMCGYALGFNADRVSLAYPTLTGEPSVRTLLSVNIGDKPTVVDSINLPMALGPEKCKAALLKVCKAELEV